MFEKVFSTLLINSIFQKFVIVMCFPRLYGLALNERIEKLVNFEIHFHRSEMKT